MPFVTDDQSNSLTQSDEDLRHKITAVQKQNAELRMANEALPRGEDVGTELEGVQHSVAVMVAHAKATDPTLHQTDARTIEIVQSVIGDLVGWIGWRTRERQSLSLMS